MAATADGLVNVNQSTMTVILMSENTIISPPGRDILEEWMEANGFAHHTNAGDVPWERLQLLKMNLAR